MRSTKYLYLLVTLFLFNCKPVFAEGGNIVFDSANAAYARGDFGKSISLYESLITQNTVSVELYFNLGNAYYKTNSIGPAILNYERAKKLNPEDEDIKTNLKLANQKAEDKIDAAPQLFLSEWKNGIIDLFSESTWSIICIFLFTLSLFLIALYFISQSGSIKKTGFFGGAFFLALAIIAYFIAGNKYEVTKNSHDAIVIAGTATVNGSPSEKGTKLFILHEGTKVETAEENEGWTEIKIANGNVGWIPSKLIAKI